MPQQVPRALLSSLLVACAPANGNEHRSNAHRDAILAPEADPGDAWWPALRAQIAADARRFHTSDDRRFHAQIGPIAATLSEDGMRADDRGDAVHLRFVAWGREAATVAVAPVPPTWGVCEDTGAVGPDGACVRTMDLRYPGIVETWQSTPRGVEQRWELAQSPAGVGLVVLLVDVVEGEDWAVSDDGDAAELTGSAGGAWRYDALQAWDSHGDPVATWMEATPSGLRILVDDTDASYPLTVDPLLYENRKLFASDDDNGDAFGVAVASAGDVNQDGYDDVIVGAYGDSAQGSYAGAAYIFLGSSDGVDTSTEIKLMASDGESGDFFGWSVDGAGDVDGDGYDDVIVGAFGDDDGGSSAGAAYVYLGSSTGTTPTAETKLTSAFGGANHYLAWSVAGVGDIDGDGYDDVIVGAHGDDTTAVDAGAAYVFFGSGSGGVDPASETQLISTDGAAYDEFGLAVGSAGDVNGDGHADVIIGAWAEDDQGAEAGAAYVYLGDPAGINPAAETKLTASDGVGSEAYGSAVDGAGDTNGDGYDDVIIGAHRDGGTISGPGAAYVYQGSSSSVQSSTEIKLTRAVPAAWDYYGFAVAQAGDFDGDGYGDVIVGAYNTDGTGDSSGSAYTYQGTASGIDPTTESELTASDAAADDVFGYDVDGAGDVNGDGASDVIIGAQGVGVGRLETGAAYIFHGTCAASTWYADTDGDGYGDATHPMQACSQPSGYVDNDTDCDDSNAAVHPRALETCDGVDEDCNGRVDDNVEEAPTWYTDGDADGYGDAETMTTSCDVPSGAVENGDDCDDGDADVYPGAPETCDGADQDCDHIIDNDPVGANTWYADADADGYTSDNTIEACDPPDGFGEPSESVDCDDADPLIHPGASEVPDDGIDQDCDGTDLEDDEETGKGGGGTSCTSARATPPSVWLAGIAVGLIGWRRRRASVPTGA